MKDNSVTGCCKACGDDSTGGWQFFTFTGSACWCHKKTGTKRPHEGYTSGSFHAQPPPGPPPSKNGVTTATGVEAAAGMPPLPSPRWFSLLRSSSAFAREVFVGLSCRWCSTVRKFSWFDSAV